MLDEYLDQAGICSAVCFCGGYTGVFEEIPPGYGCGFPGVVQMHRTLIEVPKIWVEVQVCGDVREQRTVGEAQAG